MRLALTGETRQTILEIKEQVRLDPRLRCASIDIYRAVLDDGIRTVEQLGTWLERCQTNGLTPWKPGMRPAKS